jgi:hypothetical protein
MSRPIATFDVWDTLLRRRCDPEAVKLFTGHVLASRHGARLALAFRDRWELLDTCRRRPAGGCARGRAAGITAVLYRQHQCADPADRLVQMEDVTRAWTNSNWR